MSQPIGNVIVFYSHNNFKLLVLLLLLLIHGKWINLILLLNLVHTQIIHIKYSCDYYNIVG